MNELVLAAAGSGKTQSIVDAACLHAAEQARILAVTYTRTGQRELAGRLRRELGASAPQVSGWYTFLQRHIIRPYLPRLFRNVRLAGLNFHGDPGRFVTGQRRFLDDRNRAYRLHIAKLAKEVIDASKRAPIDRLQRTYSHIYIDEVQDLVGWDLELLDVLLGSTTEIHLVGDLRQSLLETTRTTKNKRFRGVAMLDWFRAREGRSLQITDLATTYRSNQTIADFADRIFGSAFPGTVSKQARTTSHDGVFAVKPGDVTAYVHRFAPHCLRSSERTAKDVELPFQTFGRVKGLTFDRVLIYPTKSITQFLSRGTELAGRTACGFYVGVTRARHSVAIVMSPAEAEKAQIQTWDPSDD